MQTLAAEVGDLKKVLSNVKTSGVLGEIQLGNILEQILKTPEQYDANVKTKKGRMHWLNTPSNFPVKATVVAQSTCRWMLSFRIMPVYNRHMSRVMLLLLKPLYDHY